MKNADFVILGGGAAGLSAAMHLIELGASPLVIEGGHYPAHKVCGEFFSPSGLKILDRWEIHPIPITDAYVHTPSRSLHYPFPQPAGSLSHLIFDPALAGAIQRKGGELLTGARVESIFPARKNGEDHQLILTSGEKVIAKHLLIGTGRLACPGSRDKKAVYRGFKAHFTGIELHTSLHMFSFPGAYLGLSPIEEKKTNLACLMRSNKVNPLSPSHTMDRLIESEPALKKLLLTSKNLFNGWMEASVPEFGIKNPPKWPRTYFIGDAAGTIPPACGNGLSLGIHSGCMAAEFAIRDDPEGFRKEWHNQFDSQIRYGKWLHRLFLHPSTASPAFKMAEWFPSIVDKVFALTRSL